MSRPFQLLAVFVEVLELPVVLLDGFPFAVKEAGREGLGHPLDFVTGPQPSLRR